MLQQIATVRLITGIILSGLFLCAAPVRQFYPDTFFPADYIYENKTIDFTLIYKKNWILFTDPGDMGASSKSLAREYNKAGVELLYVGATVEGTQGTRGIASHLNEPLNAYAAHIYTINKQEVENDRGLVGFFSDRTPMVKWIYDKQGFRFAEFFFVVDTYNLRIAFWTKIDQFDNFLPVYEDIIISLEKSGDS